MSEVYERVVGLLKMSDDTRSQILVENFDSQSLTDLGLDSVAILQFLVSVEDAFGIEWSEDVPVEALSSVKAVVDHVNRQLGLTV